MSTDNQTKVREYFDVSYVYSMFTLHNFCQHSDTMSGEDILNRIIRQVNLFKKLNNEEEKKYFGVMLVYQFIHSITNNEELQIGFLLSTVVGDITIIEAFIESINDTFTDDTLEDIHEKFNNTINDVLDDDKKENETVSNLLKDEEFAEFYDKHKYPAMS